MLVLIRAIVYASIFCGLALVFLPGEFLRISGISRPPDFGLAQLAGVALVVLGGGVALSCVVFFALAGRGTPAPFDPPRRLVTRGPYRFVRNPMYLGAGVVLAGAALYYGSAWLLGYVIIFGLAAQLFVRFYEEPTLLRTFGSEYEAYCRRVRRWWPDGGSGVSMFLLATIVLLSCVGFGASSVAAEWDEGAGPAGEPEPPTWDVFLPGCVAGDSSRAVERFADEICAGERFEQPFGPGYRFVLEPIESGWRIAVRLEGRDDILSRLTPPWHFVPNPCFLEGWHFRNVGNTGPNDGSVNAPGDERGFIFSPEVGVTIDSPESAGMPTEEEMLRIAAFGSGELRVLDYGLADLEPGERARMVWLKFEVCVSWRRADAGAGGR